MHHPRQLRWRLVQVRRKRKTRPWRRSSCLQRSLRRFRLEHDGAPRSYFGLGHRRLPTGRTTATGAVVGIDNILPCADILTMLVADKLLQKLDAV